jgi:hypothetical protein
LQFPISISFSDKTIISKMFALGRPQNAVPCPTCCRYLSPHQQKGLTAMTDGEVLDNALPWIEELLRRNMLAVQVRIPATAVTPAKIAHAWPGYSDHHAFKDQLLLFVSDWSIEEPVNDLRTLSVANSTKPWPVS